MKTKELTEEEFKSTFGSKMTNITDKEIDPIDIWPYVDLLDFDSSQQEVELVYRNDSDTYDHVLLPTPTKNVFLVIVVNLATKNVYGHYLLDLNKEYGLS
ncbi:MAG: hypothetical protein AAFY91_18255 [Bacteroidota bacterium]